jgi:hypothetical protein
MFERAGSGPGGEIDFWKWANQRVRNELKMEEGFDVDEHFDHVRRHLPEVCES